jgi:hypothetical protein
MLYFLDERSGGSWADTTLSLLNYNSNPDKIQTLLRKLFIMAVSKIKVKGSRIVPVPLFEALDGKNTNDYVQRVEPSVSGGAKLANLIVAALQREDSSCSNRLRGEQAMTRT